MLWKLKDGFSDGTQAGTTPKSINMKVDIPGFKLVGRASYAWANLPSDADMAGVGAIVSPPASWRPQGNSLYFSGGTVKGSGFFLVKADLAAMIVHPCMIFVQPSEENPWLFV